MRRNWAIDYVEFSGGKLASTKAFYGKAFGWTFIDYGPTYAALDPTTSGLDGGFQGEPAERPNAPLVILFAEDLEATQAKVESAGGTISRPIFAFPGGRRFHFRDPAGNELAVWSPT